ncbi:MAG TPA: hypothetical protein VGJ26_15910 [Pirellulales bacterium]|jgi:hypothetical protein
MTFHFLPNRRWLRFSLRTMFIVVTLIAAFVAYHMNWIRQRRAVIEGRLGEDVYVQSWDPAEDPFNPPLAPKWRPPRGPGLLWLFGERGYANLDIQFGPPIRRQRDLTPEELARTKQIERLFPESIVHAEPMIWAP